MIRKRTYREVRLSTLSTDCSHCGKPNEYTFAEDYEETMGAVCGNCSNIMWFLRMGNPITVKSHAPPPKGRGDEHLEEIRREFFRLLPSCPACHVHQYTDFAMNYPAESLDCRCCGKNLKISAFRDVSVKKIRSEVFWFDP